MMTAPDSAEQSVVELVDAADRIADVKGRFLLTGHRYVVLGGGRGMGRHTAHALAQLGARVVVVDSDHERARETAEEIGDAAELRVADVTSNAEMSELAAELGQVDGVVDVIGIAQYRPILELTETEWNSAHDLVLRHAWLTVRHFGRLLADRGAGTLTFVTSISGLGTAPGHAAYGVFKAGLTSLVRTAALELGPEGVRVNAVAPGFTLTPRMRDVLDDAQLSSAKAAEPLPRWTTPSDIAAGIAFLVSELAAAITGHVLVMDGGATVSYPYQMRGFTGADTL